MTLHSNVNFEQMYVSTYVYAVCMYITGNRKVESRECLYKISWQSILQLLKYFSLDQLLTDWPTDRGQDQTGLKLVLMHLDQVFDLDLIRTIQLHFTDRWMQNSVWYILIITLVSIISHQHLFCCWQFWSCFYFPLEWFMNSIFFNLSFCFLYWSHCLYIMILQCDTNFKQIWFDSI